MKNLLAASVLLAVTATVGGAALPGYAAEPIKIGVVNMLTGPFAEGGSFQVNGLQLALEEINKSGGVLGRPVELRTEDNASTNPGTVLAFSKLFTDPAIKAIVGPIASTQIQAASPAIAKAGVPTMIGGTDPSLTRVNNPWVFRARPNDLYSSKVIAEFGVKTLKMKKWAIVHATDAFGQGGAKALTEALEKLGVTPILDQGYTSNAQDFTPIVLAVKKSGADVLGTYMTVPADQAIFAKQLRQLGVNIQWVGSPTTAAVTTRNLAGEALYGTYAVADFNAEANDAAREFTKRYRERYGIYPDNFASWSYDALQILALAMNNARSTEPEAIRKAILGIKGYKGLEGTYEFDARGDGLHGYNVVKNDGGKIVFIKRVDFPVE
ncbi:MAG TPA: ABC transporter substrate-binding protein [Burkholderiales bacterium]|nr:ABC transporter substrate-binding protein [Burkholderiales bacterium]